MLKVNRFNPFKPKNEKKAGMLTTVELDCNLVSRFGLISTKIVFSIERKYFQGASSIDNRVMVIFSPQPLKEWFFFYFFVKVTPPK